MGRPARRALAALALVAAGTLVAATPRGSAASTTIEGPPIAALFQYQLQTGATGPGGVDVGLCAPGWPGCARARVLDVDLYGPDGVTPNVRAVRAIHAAGGYAVCYVDAGTWESWRPDAHRFPTDLLGRPNGWPGERWLDVRRISQLVPIMAARVARCRAAGFDAVEFDNVDGYANATGFAITAADQLRYDRLLAGLAHRDHLAAGLKNDDAQVASLEPAFDFAIDESCAAQRFCAALAPFVRAHKAVYDVEYSGSPARYCAIARAAGVSAVGKALALRATPWRPCRP